MKRIAIVTWLGWYNYGTCLQAFALNQILRDLGYDPYFLEEKSVDHELSFIRKCISLFLPLYTLISRYVLKRGIKDMKLKKFRNSSYKIKPLYKDKKLYNDKVVDQFDVFISGSDQIWNTYVGYNPFMFLEFVKNKKKVSYASSIGTNDFEESTKNRVKEALNNYDHITIREKQGVDAVRGLTGRSDIKKVLDPTFLISKERWGELVANHKYPIPEDFILLYFIGKNDVKYKANLEVILSSSNYENKKVVIVQSQENPNFDLKNAIRLNDVSPLEFVSLITKSQLVITDSFHATALSINIEKNFIEFLRFQDGISNSQNTRIYDLLGTYNLLNRIYDSQNCDFLSDIKYKNISCLLANEREECKNVLRYIIEQ